MDASNMENRKIQGFEQTSMQEGGGLEVWLPASKVYFFQAEGLEQTPTVFGPVR